MVYDTYNYSYWVYKPSYNWGAHIVQLGVYAKIYPFPEKLICTITTVPFCTTAMEAPDAKVANGNHFWGIMPTSLYFGPSYCRPAKIRVQSHRD